VSNVQVSGLIKYKTAKIQIMNNTSHNTVRNSLLTKRSKNAGPLACRLL
jgi:hypothetical protein